MAVKTTDAYISVNKQISCDWLCFAIIVTAYRQNSNIRHTIVGNKIVDHSEVVGASPVGAAPITSSFST